MKRRGAEEQEAAEKRDWTQDLPEETNQLTRAIIGVAIEVHRELGPGFLEGVYEEAFVVELEERGMRFERQVRVPLYYKGRLIAESRLDLVIEGTVVVELKAVSELLRLHSAQLLSYLRAGGHQVGLLINFNVPKLTDGVRRVVWTY